MGVGPEPTVEAVEAKMAESLLAPENRLRTMMGLPLVEASTVIQTGGDVPESDEWKTEDNGDGTATLVSAPSDIEKVDLASMLTCPTVIASNAFSNCSNLTEIVLCDQVAGIQSGAFIGCSDTVVTVPADCPLPMLLGGMESMPFSFGGSVTINVAEAGREALLGTWSRQMVGVFGGDDEESYVESKWFGNVNMDTFESPKFDVLNKAVNEPLMECENRLRSL
ncbi:MAG: leucine-rich repeat protein, partial [Collinsella sp.]